MVTYGSLKTRSRRAPACHSWPSGEIKLPLSNVQPARTTRRSMNQSHHCRECGMPPPHSPPSLHVQRHAHTRNRRDKEPVTPTSEHAPSIGVRIVAPCGTHHSQVYRSVALLSPDACTVPESAPRGGRRRRCKSISEEQTSALHPRRPPLAITHMAGGRYAHAQPHGIMCWAAASRRDRRVAVDGLGGGHDGGIQRCPRTRRSAPYAAAERGWPQQGPPLKREGPTSIEGRAQSRLASCALRLEFV